MDTTLAILGGATLALYYFGKKKINDLQAQLDQNKIDDKQREDDLAKVEDRIDNPLPDGDIWIYPYVLFSNMVGKYWGGRLTWEIHNKSNTPYTITGIMSNLRLNGHLCKSFLPANSDMFPYKLQGGKYYSAYFTRNNAVWLDSKSSRDNVKNAVSPKRSEGHKIVECDVVLEILNTATNELFYKRFRNCKGDAIWKGGTDYKGYGADAKNDPEWSGYIKVLDE